MKEQLDIKLGDIKLGEVIKAEQTKDGIEIVVAPTDMFYQMKKEIEEMVGEIKVRIINRESD